MDTNIVVALIALAGVVLTIVGTLGGTWLGTSLTRRASLQAAREIAEIDRAKYAHDRLWDARKDAYTAIVVAVGATMRAASFVDQGFNDPETHPEEYCASERGRREMGDIWEKWKVATAEFERSRLLLSDAFADRFLHLTAGIAAMNDHAIPPDHYSDLSYLFDQASPDLMRIAKTELAPSPHPIAEGQPNPPSKIADIVRT